MAARGPSPRPLRGGPTLHHMLSIPPSPPGPPQNAENHRQDKLLQPREDLRIPSPPRGTDSPIGAPLPFLGGIWSFRRIEPQGFGHLPWPGAPPPGGPGTREPGEDTTEPGYLPPCGRAGLGVSRGIPGGFPGRSVRAARVCPPVLVGEPRPRPWPLKTLVTGGSVLPQGISPYSFCTSVGARLRRFVSVMLFS